jgi:hypothetical protein
MIGLALLVVDLQHFSRNVELDPDHQGLGKCSSQKNIDFRYQLSENALLEAQLFNDNVETQDMLEI